jgi:hypothetical protein
MASSTQHMVSRCGSRQRCGSLALGSADAAHHRFLHLVEGARLDLAHAEAAVCGGLMGAAINVGEIYAHLVRDVQAGTHGTPGFEHALHNARLIEAVRCAAERGERRKVAG